MNQASSKETQKTIKVNGLDVAYRFDGPENGHVILIANSLMSDFSMWDWNVPALADRYRVLRYDKRVMVDHKQLLPLTASHNWLMMPLHYWTLSKLVRCISLAYRWAE